MKYLSTFTAIVFVLTLISCKDKQTNVPDISVEANEIRSSVKDKIYTVDPTMSHVLWEGVKPGGKHNGDIVIRSGSIGFQNGVVTSGSFIIDMNTITVSDLDGDDKAYLESHLKGTAEKGKSDFFDVMSFPEARFVITKTLRLENDIDANFQVLGDLTLKDITKEVGFKVKITQTESGILATTPPFTINRTDWGIKYGSKSFFDNLKDKFIEDNMGIQIHLEAK